MPNQLTLFEIAQPKPTNGRSPEQQEWLDNFLASLMAETQAQEAIGRELFDANWSIKSCKDCSQIAEVMEVWRSRNGIKTISVEREPSKFIAKSAPYKPWSNDRKWRDRLRKLRLRAEKKYQIPDLLIDFLLSEVGKNPQYFGLCMLPEASDRCPCEYDSPARLAALAKEAELRSLESR